MKEGADAGLLPGGSTSVMIIISPSQQALPMCMLSCTMRCDRRLYHALIYHTVIYHSKSFPPEQQPGIGQACVG